MQVCPNSAKVQLNSAILMRRQSEWDAALEMVDRAQAIEPSYCEADFWRGLTMLNGNWCCSPIRFIACCPATEVVKATHCHIGYGYVRTYTSHSWGLVAMTSGASKLAIQTDAVHSLKVKHTERSTSHGCVCLRTAPGGVSSGTSETAWRCWSAE